MGISFTSVVFFLILTAIGLVDLFTKSIYDWMLLVAAVVCYALMIFAEGIPVMEIVYGLFTGLGLYGLIYLASYLYYRDEMFGMGDVLLNALIGGVLGWQRSVMTSFLTFFIAILFVVLFKIWKRGSLKELEIPFAPAMVISAGITYLYYEPILSAYLNLVL